MLFRSDAENKTTTNQTDLNNRLIKQTDGNGNVTAFEYNEDGQRIKTIYPTYAETTLYDNRGRVIKTTVTHNTGTVTETLITQTTYDRVGNRLAITDTAGRITTHTYDALNRLVSSTDPDDGVTAYGYDNRNNQITVTDANTNTHKFEYNRNNQRTKVIHPMGQTIVYTFDAIGNFLEIVDAKGQRITYTYDSANRTIQQDHYLTVATTIPTDTITYSYNKNNLRTGNTTTSAGVTTTITYNELNRKTNETINYGAFSKSYGYTYYKNGNKQSFTSPDNTIYGYTYDNANLLSSVTIPGEGAITINSRNWARPTKMTLPGGATRNWTYDGLLRPTQIATNDPANNSLMNYQYTYDTAGYITQKQTEHGAYYYQYDNQDRLTNVDNPNTTTLTDETYTYDKVGNRLSSASTPTWSYNVNNQLTGYGTTTFDYDANGNTITKRESSAIVEQYTYDNKNRLTEVKNASNTVIATYAYDPNNRRIKKTTGGQTIYYLYSNEGLIAEFDATGIIIKQYGYQPNSTWSTDPLFTKDSTNTYHYYQTDHLGTPQKLINKTGATTWAAKYQAFGEANVSTQTITNNLRFPGQYNDSETNLHYNWNRYYNNQAGRYVTSDPIGLDGGINTYGYVGGNPVRWVDPSGLLSTAGIEDPLRNTVVCNGNGGIRIQLGSTSQCTRNCMIVHEQIHIADALKINSNICKGQRDGTAIRWSNPSELFPTELRGYNAEIACLNLSLDQSCDNDCQQEIINRIAQITPIRDSYK